mmetsp:Transcript_7852/g.16843  ORF Transcript_7852/g.16843 Transcript_7852/m.16843 type:complete len:247 (+) Transcript_7852:1218-1958(+)
MLLMGRPALLPTKTEALGDFFFWQSALQVGLVGQHQQGGPRQSFLQEDFCELLPHQIQAQAVAAVHDPNDPVRFFEIIPPVGPDGRLAPDVPQVEFVAVAAVVSDCVYVYVYAYVAVIVAIILILAVIFILIAIVVVIATVFITFVTFTFTFIAIVLVDAIREVVVQRLDAKSQCGLDFVYGTIAQSPHDSRFTSIVQTQDKDSYLAFFFLDLFQDRQQPHCVVFLGMCNLWRAKSNAFLTLCTCS